MVTVFVRSASVSDASVPRSTFQPLSQTATSSARVAGGASNSESRSRSGFSPSLVRKSVQRAQSGFQQATADATVATFAANLVKLLDAGYDGIDIDWEPMDKADEPAVVDLANRIRNAKPRALLTIPIGEINVNLGADLSGYPAIAAAYDQLNIMSYGQAGAWSGWKSWHSSALYHTDSATPTSIDSTVQLYLAAKVPAAKLGIGIGFYGLCYTSPVTAPDQAETPCTRRAKCRLLFSSLEVGTNRRPKRSARAADVSQLGDRH
jgi:GH18 family chitinase